MLQNILEQEDFIKGLPDASLYGEMEQPSGQLPQFLVLSEIQRRTDMRERYEATQEQPEGTISEQIISEGLGGMPQEVPSMSPMGLASQTMGSPIPTDPASQASVVAATGAPPPPTGGMGIGASGLAGMGGPPQMTAGGGRVGYQEGGQEGDDTPAYYPIGQDAYGGRAILNLLKFFGAGPNYSFGGRETPREDADGFPPELGENRPIPELMQKYGSDYVMNFLEGEEKYSGEAKPRAVHDPDYQDAFEAAREEFYSHYPQSFIDDVNIAREGGAALEEDLSKIEEMSSGGIIGMQAGRQVPDLRTTSWEESLFMPPALPSESVYRRFGEWWRDSNARARRSSELVKEYRALGYRRDVAEEMARETMAADAAEAGVDDDFYSENPATAGYVGEETESLPVITDKMVYGETLMPDDGEEIGTQYTGTATRPIGGGDPDLIGTDTDDGWPPRPDKTQLEFAQETISDDGYDYTDDLTYEYLGAGYDQGDAYNVTDIKESRALAVDARRGRLTDRTTTTNELIDSIREEGRCAECRVNADWSGCCRW